MTNTTNLDIRIEKPNKVTIEAIDDVRHNRNMSKSFVSIGALIDDLDD